MAHTVSSLIDIPVLARGAPVLTVVVPCYNERPNVAPLIARLDAALCGIPWEVVYVDDNSPDGTAAEVRRITRAFAASAGSVAAACLLRSLKGLCHPRRSSSRLSMETCSTTKPSCPTC